MLPEMLTLWREKNRITLEQLANEIGTSIGTVWRFEHRKSITLEGAVKIFSWCLFGKINPPPPKES